MLHACAAIFDATENLKKFLVFGETSPNIIYCDWYESYNCIFLRNKFIMKNILYN